MPTEFSLASLGLNSVANAIASGLKTVASGVISVANSIQEGMEASLEDNAITSSYEEQVLQEHIETTNPIHKLYHESSDQENFYKIVHELPSDKIDTLDEKGYTLLHKALYNGQTELVKVLLEKGADLFKEGPNRSNFLQFLAECKDSNKAFKIFKTLVRNLTIRTQIMNFNVEIYKEVIKLAIANGNSNLAQTLVAIHPAKKTILEQLLEDAQPIEKEKTEISITNKDILKLERTIYELKAAKQTLEKYEQDLKTQAENLKNLHAKDKEKAATLYQRTQENFNKEKEKIGILLSPESRINASSSLDNLIVDLENKLSSARTVNKKYTLYIEQIKAIQSLFSEPQDQANKLNILTKAIEAGDSDKVRLLLEAGDSGSKYYNILNQNDETIVNIGFKKIKEIEKELDPKSANYQKDIDTIKSIYSSINLILKQPDFNLESTLNYQLPQTQKKDGSLEEKKPQVLLQAYIDFQENSNNEDPEIKYQKDILFKNLFQHKKTQKYLGHRENAFKLLQASAHYNDPETYAKLTGYTGGLSLQEKNNILFYAAQSGSQLIFNNVLNYSSDNFTQKFENNRNMLMCACNGGNLEIVKSIIENPERFGVKINQVDDAGNTVLHYLARSKGQDNIEIIENLIELGANIEAKNKEGQTPLISAVLLGNVALVKELLAKGADVNAVDKDGNTPLIYATHLNNPEIIEAVLSANELDVSHKNNKGVSAYTISLSRDFIVSTINKEATTTKVSDEAQEAINHNQNKYKNLSKILLSRGADPYKVSPTTLANLAFTTVLAAGSIKAAELISNIKDPWGIAATIGTALKAGTTLVAGVAVYNAGSSYMQGLFKRIKKKDSEKTSLADEVMIGATHKGGWLISRIKKGKALQKDMGNHPNFKDADQGIFTLKDLNTRIPEKKGKVEFQAWAVKAQESLQDKYITTKRAIEKSSFADKLLGRKKALEKNLAEIAEASKLLIEYVGSTNIFVDNVSVIKTFDDINYDIVDAIKPPKGPKALLTTLIRNKGLENIEKINDIIKQVIEKKILVSPDTYYHFCEFEKIRKITCKNQNTINNFLDAKYDKDFSAPTIHQQRITNNSSLALHTSVDKKILETKIKPPSLLQRATELGQDLLGKYILTEHAGKIATNFSGAALTYATVTLADPQVLTKHAGVAVLAGGVSTTVRNLDIMTGSVISSTLSIPANLASSAISGTASLVASHPVAATAAAVGGAAVGAALYYRPWEYFYRNKTKETIKLEPAKIGKSSIPDLLTESELETRKEKQFDTMSRLFSSFKKSKKDKIPLTQDEAARVIQKNTKPHLAQADKLTSSETSPQRNLSVSSLDSESAISAGGITTDIPILTEAALKAILPAKGLVTHVDDNTNSNRTASMSSADPLERRNSFDGLSEEEINTAKVHATARKAGKKARDSGVKSATSKTISRDLSSKPGVLSRVFGRRRD